MHTWIFLRHGESAANAGRVLSGWNDVPLTQRGREQADAAGQALVSPPHQVAAFDQVWTSDLQRARETAERAIARWAQASEQPAPPLLQHPVLRERHMGDLQGQDVDACRADGRMDQVTGWSRRPLGGESLSDLARRALPLLAAARPAGPILVVSHGGTIRTLLGLLDGIPVDKIGRNRIPNGVPLSRQVPPGRWQALADRFGDPLPTELPPVGGPRWA